jgi:predicted metal-dependent phosphoesterase TrpH/PAS domain-containing protein
MSDGPVRVELHCHSNLSDGAVSPEALAAAIAGARVSFASLTDHDTVEGCARFREALAGTGVACIDGVEITTQAGEHEVHLLGYGIDPHHEGLRAALAENRLKVDPGLPGLVDTMKRVGSKTRRSAGSPMDTAEAIRLVHAAGGKAFVAHPLSGPLGRGKLARLLPVLLAAGLDGIEAIYAPYADEDRRWLTDLAAKNRLVVSAGSDFHGPEVAAGPEPGIDMTAARWKSFRDLLLPGHERMPASRQRLPRDARRSAPGRFALRIVLPAAVAVALFVVALFAIAIPRFEAVLLDRKKEMIRELTNSAVSILREYAADERAGRLSPAEARRGAAARIRDLRYGKEGKDYFWITDMRPVMIVHPYRPELENTDVSEYRDANGVQVFVEFLKAVRDQNLGYVEYLWQWKDDSHRIVPKLSFVERFPDWDWVVGTGIYLDDVQAEIARMARWMIWLSLIITAALALILVFVTQQSLAIEQARVAAEARLRESHERYRALVEASTEGMVLLVDGAFTYANRTFLDMTGYAVSQLPLIGVDELIRAHEGEEPELARFVSGLVRDATAETPAPAPLACLLARRGGDPVEAVLTASPLVVAGRGGWILAAKSLTAARGDGEVPAWAEAMPVGVFRAAWGRSPLLVEVNAAARIMLELAGDPDGALLLEGLRAELTDASHVDRREVDLGGVRSILASATLGPVQPDGTRHVEGMLEDVTAVRVAEKLFDRIVKRLENASSVIDVSSARGQLPELVTSLLASRTGLENLNHRITRVSDLALRTLIDLAIKELGTPPAAFAFLVLGSEGREEATLHSDQDNAIIYSDGAPDDPAAVHAWFHSLGVKVCGWLEGMGVGRCQGGMMASNPRWCAPLSEWQSLFGRWIAEPEPRELLAFQVFFDFRLVFGDRSLADRLRGFITGKLAGEPPFFLHLARDAMNRRAPRLFSAGPAEALEEPDIKEALLPFVSFARLYALRHGIAATNTLSRLDALRECGVLASGRHGDLARAYGFLAELRHLPGTSAAPVTPGSLRRASEQAQLLITRISFDVLGSAL